MNHTLQFVLLASWHQLEYKKIYLQGGKWSRKAKTSTKTAGTANIKEK